jgi:hypothetical protein
LGSSQLRCAYLGHLQGTRLTNHRSERHFQLHWASPSVSFSFRLVPTGRLCMRCILRRYVPPLGYQLNRFTSQLKPRAWRLYLFRTILLPHSAPADCLQPVRAQSITRANSAAQGWQCKAFLRLDIPSAPVHFPQVPRAVPGMHCLWRFLSIHQSHNCTCLADKACSTCRLMCLQSPATL